MSDIMAMEHLRAKDAPSSHGTPIIAALTQRVANVALADERAVQPVRSTPIIDADQCGLDGNADAEEPDADSGNDEVDDDDEDDDDDDDDEDEDEAEQEELEDGARRCGASPVPRLDLTHGFIRNIVYHQVASDEYDKMLKARAVTTSKRNKPRKSKNVVSPKCTLYVPPHRRPPPPPASQSVHICEEHNSDSSKRDIKNPWLKIANKDSPERLAIRKRLEKELLESAANRHRNKATSEMVLSERFVVHSAAHVDDKKLANGNGTLLAITYSTIDGKLLQQYVRSDDSTIGLAKAIGARMGLNKKQCAELLTILQSNIAKYNQY